jgi:CHAD domain-containing protein
MTANEATCEILSNLLATIRRNEPGIVDDIDIEFLHDFRVAVRRTRSALSQIKGVIPEPQLTRFRQDFRKIGRLSNVLRDLDVYIDQQQDYEKMIPDDLQPALKPLFMSLRKQRQEEYKKVVAALKDEFYKNTVKSWNDFLKEMSESATSAVNSDKEIKPLANAFISKRYNRVIKKGGRISDASADEQLHDLRIECKKLRYLLEFFSSLYPVEDVGNFIKQLKRLQDNLGEFNDLFVQQSELRAFIRNSPVTKSSLELHTAVGALIGVLHSRQKQVRKEFDKIFKRFSDKKTRFFMRSFLTEMAGFSS